MEFYVFLFEIFWAVGFISLIVTLILNLVYRSRPLPLLSVFTKIMALIGFLIPLLLVFTLLSGTPNDPLFSGLVIASIFVIVFLILSLILKKNSKSSLFAILSALVSAIVILLILGANLNISKGPLLTIFVRLNDIQKISWSIISLYIISVFLATRAILIKRTEIPTPNQLTPDQTGSASQKINSILFIICIIIIFAVGFAIDLTTINKQIKSPSSSTDTDNLIYRVPFLRDENLWIAESGKKEWEIKKSDPGFQIQSFKVSQDKKYLAVITANGSLQMGIKYDILEIFDITTGKQTTTKTGINQQFFYGLTWSSNNHLAYLDSTQDNSIFIIDINGNSINKITTVKKPSYNLAYDWVGDNLVVIQPNYNESEKNTDGYRSCEVLLYVDGLGQAQTVATLDLGYSRLIKVQGDAENNKIVVKSFPDWQKPSQYTGGSDTKEPIFVVDINSKKIDTLYLQTKSDMVGNVNQTTTYYTWCQELCYIANTNDSSKKIALPELIAIGDWINDEHVVLYTSSGIKISSIDGKITTVTSQKDDKPFRYDL